jgi:hypothetical protein
MNNHSRSRALRAAVVAMAAGLLAPLAAAKPKNPAKPAASASASASVSAGPMPLSGSLSVAAKQDYEAAKLLYADGDFMGALLKFKSAHEQSGDARLLWNMGACEKNLRHYARVMTLARRYLDEGGALLTDSDRQEARDLIATVEGFTAGLKLNVSEEGAEVFVDDEPVGISPLAAPVVVDIGVRRIRVKKPGFVEYSASTPVGGSKEVPIEVRLVKEVHEGKLTINAGRGATIALDGKVVGMGSWAGMIPTGGHTLRVSAHGMRPYQSEVVIQDKEIRTVDVPLEALPQPVVVKKEEETGPVHGLELGLRGGYGIAYNTGEREWVGNVGFVPLWFDLGYRIGKPTFLGLFVQYAAYDKSGTCGVDRHGASPTSSTDLQVRYSYTSCWHAAAGVELVFHTLPSTIVDPWFGFDFGFQMSERTFRSFDPLGRQIKQDRDADGGPGFASGMQLGIDVRLVRGLGFGPFMHGSVVAGDDMRRWEDTQSDSPSTDQSFSVCPQGSNCNPNKDSGGGNAWPRLIFGLRVAYTFF